MSYQIGLSQIQGRGIIAKQDFNPGQFIDMGIAYYFSIVPYVTTFGSYLNHSYQPTADLKYVENPYGYAVVANQKIKPGQEITVNYATAPWYISPPMPWYK